MKLKNKTNEEKFIRLNGALVIVGPNKIIEIKKGCSVDYDKRTFEPYIEAKKFVEPEAGKPYKRIKSIRRKK